MQTSPGGQEPRPPSPGQDRRQTFPFCDVQMHTCDSLHYGSLLESHAGTMAPTITRNHLASARIGDLRLPDVPLWPRGGPICIESNARDRFVCNAPAPANPLGRTCRAPARTVGKVIYSWQIGKCPSPAVLREEVERCWVIADARALAGARVRPGETTRRAPHAGRCSRLWVKRPHPADCPIPSASPQRLRVLPHSATCQSSAVSLRRVSGRRRTRTRETERRRLEEQLTDFFCDRPLSGGRLTCKRRCRAPCRCPRGRAHRPCLSG